MNLALALARFGFVRKKLVKKLDQENAEVKMILQEVSPTQSFIQVLSNLVVALNVFDQQNGFVVLRRPSHKTMKDDISFIYQSINHYSLFDPTFGHEAIF